MEQRAPSAEAVETAFSTFRRQQRRPSNLLQCMDKDGNIDAFRYIEYSRQRRMDFIRRADFICKMKSTLRLQQQQIHRSASLPGMTGPPVATSTANEVFPKDLKSRGNSIVSKADAFRLLSRSGSMPIVSSLAMTHARRASLNQQKNATFESNPPTENVRRSLRKEEFEAAEALLFGMKQSKSASEKRNGEEEQKTSSKKQRLMVPRTEEMGSVVSVVSTEEDSSSNNASRDNSANGSALQGDEGIARVKSSD